MWRILYRVLLLLLLVAGAAGVWWYFPPRPRLVLSDVTEALTYSPNGKVLLTWLAPDNTLQFRDPATGNVRASFTYPASLNTNRPQPDVVFSPDGLLVAVGAGDRNPQMEAKLRVVRLSDAAEIVEKKVYLAPFGASFTFSADSKWLAYADNEFKLCVLPLAQPQGLLTRLEGAPPLLFSADGKWLAATTYGMPYKVTQWDTATWKPMKTWQELPRQPICLTLSADQSRLAVAVEIDFRSGADPFFVQDVASGKTLYSLESKLGPYRITALRFLHQDKILEASWLDSSGDPTPQTWDLTTAPPTRVNLSANCLSADGRRGLRYHDGKFQAEGVDVFEFPGNNQRMLFAEEAKTSSLFPIAISADGAVGAISQSHKLDYRLLLVDLPSGRIETSLPSHMLATALFSPDGQSIIVQSRNILLSRPDALALGAGSLVQPVEIWDVSPSRPWAWVVAGWGCVAVLCAALFLAGKMFRRHPRPEAKVAELGK